MWREAALVWLEWAEWKAPGAALQVPSLPPPRAATLPQMTCTLPARGPGTQIFIPTPGQRCWEG